ncbi:anti-sigma factor [Pannonibacter tanglangensis]|uniref:Regulator of SigK n=1 Tax=Pannonibacter tanglangensis TaxID=2750084 RepID=A0ABW9ZJW8_9HYPH|nr:anti-sigma factor [Pannonibacter sp. XCT-34]NBN65198.1 hypothetical protein [Pannonibacter sp. XCT-34]
MTGRAAPPGADPAGPAGRPELDALAGEFVLGSLGEDERREAEERLQSDPHFARLVADWRHRLAPLDEAVLPVAPPPDLLARIESEIDARVEASADVRIASRAAAPALSGQAATGGRLAPSPGLTDLDLMRRLRIWRAAALSALATSSALAASVAVLLWVPAAPTELPPVAAPGPVATGARYLAVVNRDGAQPAIVVSVDTQTGIVSLRDLGAEQPADRSLEVWYLAGDNSRPPLSLGVLADSAEVTHLPVRDADYGRQNAAIAITLEPKGGSPNGDPTGPVVYSGRLIPEPR